MSGGPRTDGEIPLTIAIRIDSISDSFERKLKAGHSPRIEDELSAFSGKERIALLTELLVVELSHLQHNARSELDAYQKRFSNDVVAVNNAFNRVFGVSLGDSDWPSFQQYECLRRIGAGAMGTVYQAVHRHLKRPVAIKVIQHPESSTFASLQGAVDEIKAAGLVSHRNMIQTWDAGFENGFIFLAMELAIGFDLAKTAQLMGPLNCADACEIVLQASRGLQHASAQEIVHRDVKPSNLILCQNPLDEDEVMLKVADFGLAVLKGDLEKNGKKHNNRIVGTLHFMAPEQFSSPQLVDQRSDIYSLACTLFTLLMGHPPYDELDDSRWQSFMLAHKSRPFPELTGQRPDVSSELDLLIRRMAEKDPVDRPGSHQEVVESLGRFSAGSNLGKLFDQTAQVSDFDFSKSAGIDSTLDYRNRSSFRDEQ